ncbi:site-specific tyrosine recombinase XerD, partial [Alcaligenes pakistanensis]
MTQASLISDFITMLWLQDGLAANTQQAYRQDLER